MGKTSIVYHEGIADYDFGLEYEVRGNRFPRYLKLLESKGVFNGDIDLVEPEPASDDDLLLVHSDEYINRVERLAEQNGFLAEDTPLNLKIVKATRLIVGAALKAGELVAEGKVHLAQGVGGGLHHAGRDYGDGFCVFNDVAVCAKSLLDRYGFERVMIFDTDAHAGNGTMDIFYDEPRVLQLSVHQDPKTLFPYTGFIEQIGRGDGEGYKVNVPLPMRATDSCMAVVIDEVFKPLVEQFNPNVIIRIGGADPLHDDDYADLSLTYNGLRMIGHAAAEAASQLSCGLVDLVCSGYNPGVEEIGLYSILSGELGLNFDYKDNKEVDDRPDLVIKTREVVDKLSLALKDHWKLG